MVRKVIILGMVGLLVTFPLYAQREKARRFGGGWFAIGLNMSDLGKLNDRLKTQGFADIRASRLAFGGGGYGLLAQRIVIGGEGSGFSQEVSSPTQVASISGGYGFFTLGYAVVSTRRLRFFPALGIGGGGINLHITPRMTSPTFDEVLENPEREVRLLTGSFLINFSLGMDYLIILGRSRRARRGEGGFLVGVRVGYILAPSKTNWKMEKVDVIGGPDARLTGPYIQLLLGGGGRGQ